MNSETIFLEILERLAARNGSQVIISEQELYSWPIDVVTEMKTVGLITKASPAKDVVCPGCERECLMSVDILVNSNQVVHAFVTCDKRSDITRVPVSIYCVKQWQISGKNIANLIVTLLDIKSYGIDQTGDSKWELGLLKGTKHSGYLSMLIKAELQLSLSGHIISLVDVVSFINGKFVIDRRRLNHLADNPVGSAGDKETAQQRRERLQKRVNDLKERGIKPFLKTVAKEEGISESRLKQILSNA
ncbi:TPA: hypothetical protein ACUTUG_001436 [Legionella pneumophila]|uniref:hypothetical protein n=1 Tax=Legionella pneumophila TaxID=446 RepID=UPI001C1AF473|nr:hypothetical protein [Legionella pneumophila]